MATEAWCLFITRENVPVGRYFPMPFDDRLSVGRLTEEVQKRSPSDDFAHLFEVWRCSDPATTFQSNNPTTLEERVKKVFSDNNVEWLDPMLKISNLRLREGEVLFFQLPADRGDKRKRGEPVDTHERLKKMKLVSKPPSEVASPSQYKAMQTNPEERILDGRPSPDNDMPPIALLYHGFGHFIDIYRGQKNVPGLDQVDRKQLKQNVDEFAQRMVSYYKTEVERKDKGLESLHGIFQSRSGTLIPRPMSASIGPHISDGHNLGNHGGANVVVEFKNEITGITSIPVVRATAYVAQTHKLNMDNFPAVFRGWRVPCLGLTVVSCDVTFYAIVAIGTQYRVIPLTPTLSCLPDASDGEDRKCLYSAFVAASVLLACILDDGRKYAEFPPPEIPDGSHRYPAISRIRRHNSDGFVNFQILEFHPDRQPYRWLYIAKTDDGEYILVKFTRHYCIDLHSFCANRDHSPQILGFERLPGGWYGVAMRCLLSATTLLESEGLQTHGDRWAQELKELVNSFHDAGFVHGDLRHPNIIWDGQQLLLVDFDWAGRAGEVSYPIELDNLNPDLLMGRSSTDATITVADDIRVLGLTLGKIFSSIHSSIQ